MKGANYIPPDMFMPRIFKDKPETYNQTIDNAIKANFNMLRLWGGGQF
jgi:beta-mannosidase